jgi:mycothiol synthase
MTTIQRYPYRGEADFESLAHLINTCDAVDKLEQGISIAELRDSYNSGDPEKILKNICLWKDTDDRLIGYSQLRITEPSQLIEGNLHFIIHPNDRSDNLESQIFDWSKLRLQEVNTETGVPVKLCCDLHEHDRYRTTIIKQHGFTIDRYFLRLERSLSESIPEAKFPNGFTLGFVNGERDAEAVVDLYNNSFIDAWNFHPLTVDDLKRRFDNKTNRRELDLVAVGSDGTLVTWFLANFSPSQNERNGRKEGWIEFLGTRRGFRKMGLGRAMLLSGLHQLKKIGLETARMCVDTENPSNALNLYESVGFSKLSTIIHCSQDI